MGVQISRLSNLLNQINFGSFEEVPPEIATRQKKIFDNSIKFAGASLCHEEKRILDEVNVECRKGDKMTIVEATGMERAPLSSPYLDTRSILVIF